MNIVKHHPHVWSPVTFHHSVEYYLGMSDACRVTPRLATKILWNCASMIAQQFWLLIHYGAVHKRQGLFWLLIVILFMQIICLLKVYVNMIHDSFYQLDIESLENYTSMIIHVGVILLSTNKLGWDVWMNVSKVRHYYLLSRVLSRVGTLFPRTSDPHPRVSSSSPQPLPAECELCSSQPMPPHCPLHLTRLVD